MTTPEHVKTETATIRRAGFRVKDPAGVLYIKLLRQEFFRRPETCARKDRGSFRHPIEAGVIILA